MASKTANTNYTLHNPANEFCNGLRLLACSKANDASVCAPLFTGQAARHKRLDTTRSTRRNQSSQPDFWIGSTWQRAASTRSTTASTRGAWSMTRSTSNPAQKPAPERPDQRQPARRPPHPAREDILAKGGMPVYEFSDTKKKASRSYTDLDSGFWNCTHLWQIASTNTLGLERIPKQCSNIYFLRI